MLIEIKRYLNVPSVPEQKGFCVGHMSVNGVYLCNTMEPVDYYWDIDTDLGDIFHIKAVHSAAIPSGRYPVTLRVYSAKFGGNMRYRELCDGCVPRLLSVPGYAGVLFHAGNSPYDTTGCILTGFYQGNAKLSKSWAAFCELYNTLRPAMIRGEDIECQITRRY